MSAWFSRFAQASNRKWATTVAVMLTFFLAIRIVPDVTPWLFLLVLVLALWQHAASVSEDPWLWKIVLGSFALRACLGIGLFYASLWQLPILESLQIDGGFWAFAPDGKGYHDATEAALALLANDLPPPQALGLGEGHYNYILLVLYALLGPHPLNAIILNCWLGAATAVFAYLIGQKLGGTRGARISAVMVTVWPSTFLWSTQMLKDPLVIFLSFVIAWIVVKALVESANQERYKSVPQLLGTSVSLLLLTVGLLVMNQYVPVALIMAGVGVMLPVSVYQLLTPSTRRSSVVLIALSLALLAALPLSRSVPTVRTIIAPPDSELAYMGFGQLYLRRGQYDEAIEEYTKALTAAPDFRPGWFNLSVARKRTGQAVEAKAADQTWWSTGLSALPRNLQEARSATQFAPLLSTVPVVAEEDRSALTVVDTVDSPDGLRIVELADLADRDSHMKFLVVPERQGAPVALMANEWLMNEPAAKEESAANEDSATSSEAVRPTIPSDRTVLLSVPRPLFPGFLGRLEVNVLSRLNGIRVGFLNVGGATTQFGLTQFETSFSLVAFFPQAIRNVVLYPLPWEIGSGLMGSAQVLAALEALATLVMLPLFVVGVRQVVQRRDAARLFLLLFGLILVLVIGLAIPNLGTVFRKKAFALFPLFLVACSSSWRDVALMFRRTETPHTTTGRILDR
jgi:tetratricopeptide (TPR) repeat protein